MTHLRMVGCMEVLQNTSEMSQLLNLQQEDYQNLKLPYSQFHNTMIRSKIRILFYLEA
jgi:hypothetical protein